MIFTRQLATIKSWIKKNRIMPENEKQKSIIKLSMTLENYKQSSVYSNFGTVCLWLHRPIWRLVFHANRDVTTFYTDDFKHCKKTSKGLKSVTKRNIFRTLKIDNVFHIPIWNIICTVHHGLDQLACLHEVSNSRYHRGETPLKSTDKNSALGYMLP